MPENSQAWVVLKFGGTSVSSAANWHNIAGVVRARIAASLRPVIVHSALSGITDRLESLLAAAAAGTHAGPLGEIDARHRDLARALRIVPSPQFERFMRELSDLAELVGASRPRITEHLSQFEQDRFIARKDRQMFVQRDLIETFLSRAQTALTGGGSA